MNKIFLTTATIMMLSGCASSGGHEITTSPQHAGGKQDVFDWNSKVMSDSVEGQVTVDGLKSQFKDETGRDLPVPILSLSCRGVECYYNTWVDAYRTNIAAYRNHKMEIANEKEAAYLANPKLAIQKEIDAESINISGAIAYFTNRYPWRAAEMNYRARSMCNEAIGAQRRGASLGELSVAMESATNGGDPADKHFIGLLSTSCWKIGSYGVKSISEL